MKILSAKQLSEADKFTIEKENIISEELMERAATLVFEEIHKRLQGAPIPIKIFCGIGNNGGDGLVIARHLIQHGYQVTTYVVNYSEKRSADFLANYDKLKNITRDWPHLIKSEDDFPELGAGDFIIDAMFGIGLNRPLENWVGKLVKHLNDSQAFILAVDMPSGLFSDKTTDAGSVVIQADYTLSFQAPKLVFYLPGTMDFVGDLQILDIGLDREFLAKLKSDIYLIGREEAASLYRTRKMNSHKGDYGSLLVAGGSYGKMGSVLLSAKAALRTGTGLCTLYVPKSGYQIIQTALPEAMVLTDESDNLISSIPVDFDADILCFGMGGGTHEDTTTAFRNYLKKAKNPVLVDADGINIIAQNREMLELLPEGSVLTPHPGELKRLIGEWKDDFEKLDKTRELSEKYKAVIVIKGAYTFIINGKETFINTTGNPGMATAGSGDVLSGVISSLMGQQYGSVAAAVLGVYLHGGSGDLVANDIGLESVMAGDIANNIGRAIQALFKRDAT